jgi:hypothetical protein
MDARNLIMLLFCLLKRGWFILGVIVFWCHENTAFLENGNMAEIRKSTSIQRTLYTSIDKKSIPCYHIFRKHEIEKYMFSNSERCVFRQKGVVQ